MSKINFTEEDKKRIEESVKKVEKRTSGEIVTYFAHKSDNYYEAPFIASSISAILSLVFINILSHFWLLPFEFNILNFSAIILSIMVVIFLAVQFIPLFKHAFISEKREGQMAAKKAVEVFVNEEVFNTKDRTGILIFVSEFEQKVEVIADSGINNKVEQEDWNEIVETIIKSIKNKKVVDGIVSAIEKCGELLLKNDFIITKDDTNELSDEIIIEK